MNTWIMNYELADGTADAVEVSAVNRVMAFELFSDIAKENNWSVVAVDAIKK